jgi:predicted nucleic acid-binding protein
MPNVISDSSCLIALDNIGMVFILKDLYEKIYITEEVYNEFGQCVEDWIEIKPVENKNYLVLLNQLVDLGEASTIALSLELTDSLMILDDKKARTVANHLNLKFTCLLGIILKAKQQEIIPCVSEVLNKLKLVNFRISKAIENEVLRLANENKFFKDNPNMNWGE